MTPREGVHRAGKPARTPVLPLQAPPPAATLVAGALASLASVLRHELDERCRKPGLRPEWGDVLRDRDRLQQATIAQGGETWTVRTQAAASCHATLNFPDCALQSAPWRLKVSKVTQAISN